MVQSANLERESFEEMVNVNNTEVVRCLDVQFGAQFFIFLSVMPFQILLMKVLIKDLGFKMPRHIIMFSMSMSDFIQPLSLCIIQFIARVSESDSNTTICHVIRGAGMFILVLTITVSSIGVIAMSVERYVACIHSFHLHSIFTHERVVYGSILQWTVGIILGLTEVLTTKFNTMAVVTADSSFQITFIMFSFAAAIPVCVIQVRLFFFARKKMKQINPEGAFGAKLELVDYRKKQIKVAVVSGIIVFGFLICMLPTAFLFLHEILNDTTVPTSIKDILFSLTIANCLVDPFIYGIGLVDTRKMILGNLKKVKRFITNKLFPSKANADALFTI